MSQGPNGYFSRRGQLNRLVEKDITQHLKYAIMYCDSMLKGTCHKFLGANGQGCHYPEASFHVGLLSCVNFHTGFYKLPHVFNANTKRYLSQIGMHQLDSDKFLIFLFFCWKMKFKRKIFCEQKTSLKKNWKKSECIWEIKQQFLFWLKDTFLEKEITFNYFNVALLGHHKKRHNGTMVK